MKVLSKNFIEEEYFLLVDTDVDVTTEVYHTGVVVDAQGSIIWSSIDEAGPLTRVRITPKHD